jgi:hypothetical protein
MYMSAPISEGREQETPRIVLPEKNDQPSHVTRKNGFQFPLHWQQILTFFEFAA